MVLGGLIPGSTGISSLFYCQDWAGDDRELGLAQLLVVPPLVLCLQGLGNNKLNL